MWWVFCVIGPITAVLNVCCVYPAALCILSRWSGLCADSGLLWNAIAEYCDGGCFPRSFFTASLRLVLYLSTQASLEMTLSGCSAADCCAVPGYASLRIFHREKSVSWTCLICLLFSAPTLPIHQTELTVAARQFAVPRRILLSVSPPVI